MCGDAKRKIIIITKTTTKYHNMTKIQNNETIMRVKWYVASKTDPTRKTRTWTNRSQQDAGQCDLGLHICISSKNLHQWTSSSLRRARQRAATTNNEHKSAQRAKKFAIDQTTTQQTNDREATGDNRSITRRRRIIDHVVKRARKRVGRCVKTFESNDDDLQQNCRATASSSTRRAATFDRRQTSIA